MSIVKTLSMLLLITERLPIGSGLCGGVVIWVGVTERLFLAAWYGQCAVNTQLQMDVT